LKLSDDFSGATKYLPFFISILCVFSAFLCTS
jgi:hypothetical protein